MNSVHWVAALVVIKSSFISTRSRELEQRAAVLESLRAGRTASEIISFFGYGKSFVYNFTTFGRTLRLPKTKRMSLLNWSLTSAGQTANGARSSSRVSNVLNILLRPVCVHGLPLLGASSTFFESISEPPVSFKKQKIGPLFLLGKLAVTLWKFRIEISPGGLEISSSFAAVMPWRNVLSRICEQLNRWRNDMTLMSCNHPRLGRLQSRWTIGQKIPYFMMT